MRNATGIGEALLRNTGGVIPREVCRNVSWNTTAVRTLRSALVLRDDERRLIVGCILGDGSLTPTATHRSYRLQIVQCNAQEAYLRWKYERLQSDGRSLRRRFSKRRTRGDSEPSAIPHSLRWLVGSTSMEGSAYHAILRMISKIRSPWPYGSWMTDADIRKDRLCSTRSASIETIKRYSGMRCGNTTASRPRCRGIMGNFESTFPSPLRSVSSNASHHTSFPCSTTRSVDPVETLFRIVGTSWWELCNQSPRKLP